MDDVGEYKASEYIPHTDMTVMDDLINLQEDTTGEIQGNAVMLWIRI